MTRYLKLLILIPFSFLLFRHFLIAPLDHHIVETIIDMNRIVKGSIWDYHTLTHASTKPLYYFFAHLIYQWTPLGALHAFAILGVLEINFLIVSIYLIARKSGLKPLTSLLSVAFFFLSFKYLQIIPLTLEDNLSYYALLLWFFYFLDKSNDSFRNSLKAGLLLGLATSFHAVCNIFFITTLLALILFKLYRQKISWKKQLLIPLIALLVSLGITELLPDDHSNMIDVVQRIMLGRLDHRSSLTGFSQGPVYALFSTIGKFINGLDHENDWYSLSYYYVIYSLNILLLFIVLRHLDWKKSDGIFSFSCILIALLFVLFYGASRTMRWDIVALPLLYLYLKENVRTRSYFMNKVVMIILILGSMDIFIRPIKSVPIEDSYHQQTYYDYYLKEKAGLDNSRLGTTILLPWEYLLISGHLETHFPRKMRNVFFVSPEGKFFQSRTILHYKKTKDDFIMRGEELEFFSSGKSQNELMVTQPFLKGEVYRSPNLGKNWLPES